MAVLSILYGTLAPEGCVMKLAGHERVLHSGPARVFDPKRTAFEAVQSRTLSPETSSSSATKARAAAPACAKCRRNGRHRRSRIDEEIALITDGRFSGATHGLMVGHVAPEAAAGGPIALLRDGDIITLDVLARRLDVKANLEERRAQWKPPAPNYTTGVMAKYAKLVSSASQGAVTSAF